MLVISPNYPSSVNKHSYGFVHARNKIYKKKGIEVLTYVPLDLYPFHLSDVKPIKYCYEGILVIKDRLISLKRIIRVFDPDMLAIHSPNPYILRFILEFKLPVIVWIHGAEVLISAFHHYIPPIGFEKNLERAVISILQFFRNFLLRKYLQRVDAIIYVSHWMRRIAEKYLLMKHPNSFVIPNPIDTNLFRPLNIKKRKEGVTIRALEWKYGLDIAIKAFAKSEIPLTIVGRGSLERYLRKLARKINANVKFVTHGIPHNELAQFYNQFIFFLAPSRTEAQGVAMCEAMASGLPVIATKVGGIPEFVKHRYNGLLVPPEDPISIRKAVKMILADQALYEAMAKNAREFVVKNLSSEIIFRKEFSIFKELL